MRLVELASGVDALYLSGAGAIRAQLFEELGDAKAQAQELGELLPYPVGGIEFGLASYGWGKYAYRLEHPSGRVRIRPDGSSTVRTANPGGNSRREGRSVVVRDRVAVAPFPYSRWDSFSVASVGRVGVRSFGVSLRGFDWAEARTEGSRRGVSSAASPGAQWVFGECGGTVGSGDDSGADAASGVGARRLRGHEGHLLLESGSRQDEPEPLVMKEGEIDLDRVASVFVDVGLRVAERERDERDDVDDCVLSSID